MTAGVANTPAERIVAALEYIGDARAAPTQFGPGFDRVAVMHNAGYSSYLDAAGRAIPALAGAVSAGSDLD